MSPKRIFACPIVLLWVALACRGDVSPVTAPRSPALVADNVATASATQRPIDDFITAQGNFEFGWTAPEQRTGARADNLFIFMDYTGVRARQIRAAGGPALGTTFSGTVTERPLADGTAEVHVVLHTDNAFTLGRQLLTGILIFGHTQGQVVGGADVALGSCDLEVTFINTAPGAALPDLGTLFARRFKDIKDIFFRGSADGTLRAAFGVPEGTPGRGHVVQNGVFQASGKGATADGFPAELITFKVVGN